MSRVEAWTRSGLESPVIGALGKLMARAWRPSQPIRLRVNGHWMYAQSADRVLALWLWKAGVLEHSELSLLRRIVRPHATVIDVGANLGFYTLELARLVGAGGVVHAFEPEPANYRLLSQAIGANGYDNVVAHEVAVSDRSGSTELFLSEIHQGDHRILPGPDHRRHLTVRMTSVDEFLPPPVRVDVIKIDVQGAEGRVLRGMEGTIRVNPSIVVLVEFSPRLMRAAGEVPAHFVSHLHSFDLPVGRLDRKRGRVEPIPRSELLALADAGAELPLVLGSA
jgi:FkbM family methyltransferase